MFLLIGHFLFTLLVPGNSQDREFHQFSHNGQTIVYGIQLPSDFSSDQTYPVLIGPSEVADHDDQSFYWRGVKDTDGWILVDFGIYQYARKKEQVLALLKHLNDKYQVEGSKFHTVCFSANSAAIFDMVMDIPEKFHSITGMAGNPRTRNKQELSKLKEVRVQFIVGSKDAFWLKAAEDRHTLLKQAGVDSSIEVINGAGHIMEGLIGKKFLSKVHQLRNR